MKKREVEGPKISISNTWWIKNRKPVFRDT